MFKKGALSGKQRVEFQINSVDKRTVVLLNPSFFTSHPHHLAQSPQGFAVPSSLVPMLKDDILNLNRNSKSNKRLNFKPRQL